LRWTKAYRKSHGKELAHDLTFAFEKQRNVVAKYDRELVRETLSAIERVSQVQQERQVAFYQQRMRVKQRIEQREAAVELARQQLGSGLRAIEKLPNVQRRLSSRAVTHLARHKARATLVSAGAADASGIGASTADISTNDAKEMVTTREEMSD
jgi:large subunit ribosomal protein L24e